MRGRPASETGAAVGHSWKTSEQPPTDNDGWGGADLTTTYIPISADIFRSETSGFGEGGVGGAGLVFLRASASLQNERRSRERGWGSLSLGRLAFV